MTDRPTKSVRWVGWAVIALAIAGMAQTVIVQQQRGEEIACQTEYNQAFTEALTQRSQWTTEDRLALNQTLRAILDSPTAEGTADALRNYLTISQVNAQKRAENPLPTEDCD